MAAFVIAIGVYVFWYAEPKPVAKTKQIAESRVNKQLQKDHERDLQAQPKMPVGTRRWNTEGQPLDGIEDKEEQLQANQGQPDSLRQEIEIQYAKYLDSLKTEEPMDRVRPPLPEPAQVKVTKEQAEKMHQMVIQHIMEQYKGTPQAEQIKGILRKVQQHRRQPYNVDITNKAIRPKDLSTLRIQETEELTLEVSEKYHEYTLAGKEPNSQQPNSPKGEKPKQPPSKTSK